MKIIRFPSWVLLIAFVCAVGCATRTPDPLAGWKGGTTAYEGNPYDKTITDDYRNHIQKLPPAEKNFISDVEIRFFEDGTGRGAVKIEVGLNGIWWEHVLIYDKDNKRVKVIKYKNGGYRS